MDFEVGYNLYLPPEYDAPQNKNTRYPVLYWLHGMNQSESTDQYPAHFLDEAIRANAIKPMIVIYASGGQRTYYTDNSNVNSRAETAIIDELIPHVDAAYRTNATRNQRAIAGMSMGGFGALKFAFKHPELFSSVTAFAPGLRDPETAEALCPKNHFYGTKRPCIDTNYYETFNLPHVRLIDLRNDPIRTAETAARTSMTIK